jgi:predicted signal transduction protein with EAL and GGDEF domain
LGHTAGDSLLREVATRLRRRLRSEDTLARFGSDEFVVVVPGLRTPEFSIEIAHGLLRTLAEPMTVDSQELITSASIGIAVFPDHGVETEDVLRAAISAKCRVKQQGGSGCRLYSKDMDFNAREHMMMVKNLRQALAREELRVYYQPQIDPTSGLITGVEALLRWRHPELGLVPPMRFIPLAEETGLIVEIGEWVLEEAVRQAAKWQRAEQPLRVSVNLSARQAQQIGLPELVSRVLESSGLPPELLEMELTESAFMARGGELQHNLEALKSLGVRLAVDDFGTGYSSLAYLRNFPLDVLKVDRSFVRGLEVEEVDIAIVRAVVELAHALGLEVVAEGVETTGQRRLLTELFCDTLQGYLFSPPVPPEELANLLDQAVQGEFAPGHGHAGEIMLKAA